MADPKNPSEQSISAAQLVKQAVQRFLNDNGVYGNAADTIAAGAAANILSANHVATSVIGSFLSGAAEIAALVIKEIGDVRKAAGPGLNDLLAAALSEVLQIEVSSAGGLFSAGPSTGPEQTRAAGKSLLDSFERLVTAGTGDAQPGATGAAAFTGFAMKFAVAGSILSIVPELVSAGQLEEFAEIPELLNKALGLGRLTRQALRPLINNAVTKPYDRELRAKYRQDSLAEGHLIKAYLAGDMTREEFFRHMAGQGLPDPQIEILVQQSTPRVTDREAELLSRYGVITPEQAVTEIQKSGMPKETAALKLRALQLGRVDHLQQAYIHEAFALAQQRYIDAGEFAAILDKAGIPEPEAQQWRARLGVHLESQHKRLTLGEMMKAHEEGHITLADFDLWAESEGYNTDDALILQLILLTKEADDEKKRKAAEARAAAKASKPPKP